MASLPERPPPRGEGCTHAWEVASALEPDGFDSLDVVTVVRCVAGCGVQRTAPGARVPIEGAPPDWIGWVK